MRKCGTQQVVFSFALAALSAAGCGTPSGPQQATKAPESRGADSDRVTEQVIAWAYKAGYGTTGTISASVGDTSSPLGPEWIAAGRAIPGAEDVLLNLLASDDERLHPTLAIQGLGLVGSKKCVPALAKFTEDPVVGFFAVCALHDLALPECAFPLATVLSTTGDASSRYYAIQGLAKIGDRAAVEALREVLERARKEERQITEAMHSLREDSRGSENER
jgi:hypothetical protein